MARGCLCGMLAAEIESSPEKVRQAVQAFFKANENWLAKILAEGEAQDTLDAGGKPEAATRALYAALQGSLLACRLFQTRARLEEVAEAVRQPVDTPVDNSVKNA